MHYLSKNFLEKLKEVDPCLGAIYDSQDDAIYVNATRQGQQIHELTVKRQFAENYEELENRTVKKLQECDVWKKFGTGNAYEDYLWAEEERLRKIKKAEVKAKRLSWFKDNRELVKAAVWNAQHGRMDKSTALPYHTASVSMMAEKTDNTGFKISDKRVRIMEHTNGLKDQGESK